MDGTQEFTVVINHEGQYAVWPAFKPVPNGWKKVGFKGNKASCLEYIEEAWTDMRPLSIRKIKTKQDE